MEDSDDNNDNNSQDLGNLEEDDNSYLGSNTEKGTRISKESLPNKPRYTIVKNNFSEEEESIDNKENNSKISHDSKQEEEKKKKEHKNDHKKESKDITIINYKIILVGDISVGKTSIIRRYINNSFSDDYNCTIQADQQTKIIEEDENTSIRLNIWDTVGQEKFRSITRQFYRDCQGAFIVFDLSRKKSFEEMQVWLNDIKNYGNNDTVIIILGNKSDLSMEREISSNDIKDKLNELDEEYIYFEVNAKNGNNISMAFDKMKKLIMENKKKIEDKKLKEENIKKVQKKSKSKSEKDEEKRTQSLNELYKDYHEKNKRCC